MHYRERFNIQGRNLEYIGIYIQLYGLTDLFIEFEYLELMKDDKISAAEVEVGQGVEKQLRCIAETAEGRKFLAGFAYWGSGAHHAARGYSRSAPDWYINRVQLDTLYAIKSTANICMNHSPKRSFIREILVEHRPLLNLLSQCFMV